MTTGSILARETGRDATAFVVHGYRECGLLRRLWKTPAAATGFGGRARCCLCVQQGSAGTGDEAVAPYLLSESEWLTWRRFRRPQRRRIWLRGRVAAKDAVRHLLMDRYEVMASMETITVLPGEHGQPRIDGSLPADIGVRLMVSISHCAGASAALVAEASPACRGLGLDVASLAENHEGLAEGGFSKAETRLLGKCPAAQRDEWRLRLWCAKEAAGKALETGLMGNPLNFQARVIDFASGRVEMETAEAAVAVLSPAELRRRVRLRTGCGQGMAFAVARLR